MQLKPSFQHLQQLIFAQRDSTALQESLLDLSLLVAGHLLQLFARLDITAQLVLTKLQLATQPTESIKMRKDNHRVKLAQLATTVLRRQ